MPKVKSVVLMLMLMLMLMLVPAPTTLACLPFF
jgi:hypothetical protein